MIFEVDRQTLSDLGLIQTNKDDKSIYSFYNRAVTKGGQEMLRKLFLTPVADLELLEWRKEEINFFFKQQPSIQIIPRNIDFVEYYLKMDRKPLRDNLIDAYYNGISYKLSNNGDYWNISTGIMHIIGLLSDLQLFMEESIRLQVPDSIKEDFAQIQAFISGELLIACLKNPPKNIRDLSFYQINYLDNLIRVTKKEQFREILKIVYKFDVLQSLAELLKCDGFSLPEYCTGKPTVFEVKDAHYPILKKPVANSFSFEVQSNLCFITGPNMAGKSTFLKTIGLLVYLSHLGFPVPAKKLRSSVFDGIFTTINLSDNLNLGYSHFYSEVKRVKDVVSKLTAEKNLVVIFDELFRGTNVKDAYDGSLLIISSLAKIRGSYFFISSHIL